MDPPKKELSPEAVNIPLPSRRLRCRFDRVPSVTVSMRSASSRLDGVRPLPSRCVPPGPSQRVLPVAVSMHLAKSRLDPFRPTVSMHSAKSRLDPFRQFTVSMGSPFRPEMRSVIESARRWLALGRVRRRSGPGAQRCLDPGIHLTLQVAIPASLSCVQNVLQIGSWLRWWVLVGNAQRCPQGRLVGFKRPCAGPPSYARAGRPC
jgi:hypothetical protein